MGIELTIAVAVLVAAGIVPVAAWLRRPARGGGGHAPGGPIVPDAAAREAVEPEIVAPEVVAEAEGEPEITALTPVARARLRPFGAREDRRDLGWVAALATAAPIAAIGLYAHHRRFVGYHRFKGLDVPLTFGRWLRNELRDASVLGWWHVRGLLPDRPAAPEPARRLVVCVHGYTQNGTNFVGLRRVLHDAGHPTAAISLGHRLAPISWYAARLARELERLRADHPEGIDLVAHSMGGVVLRIVLRDRPELREAVRTVVTLGSPHRGTAAARGIPLLPEVRALKRRSALLRDLPHLPDLVPQARVVTVAGDVDTVVYPVDTALVDGAEHVVLRGIGHAGLLTNPRAWATVRKVLAAGRADAGDALG